MAGNRTELSEKSPKLVIRAYLYGFAVRKDCLNLKDRTVCRSEGFFPYFWG